MVYHGRHRIHDSIHIEGRKDFAKIKILDIGGTRRYRTVKLRILDGKGGRNLRLKFGDGLEEILPGLFIGVGYAISSGSSININYVTPGSKKRYFVDMREHATL